MNIIKHIPASLVKTLTDYIKVDKPKRDKPETYVKPLIRYFYRVGDGRPWLYADGHFQVSGDLENESGVAELIYACGGTPTKAKIGEVLFQISRLAVTVPPTAAGINVANGFVHFGNGRATLHPHSESHGQRYALSFAYNNIATAPLWQSFLNRVLPDVTVQEYLQDFFGYVLLGSARPHAECFSVWKGNGANGKSVALGVLKALIGQGNYSSLSMHEMTPRNTEDLANKLANIGSETERSAILQTSVLKKMVSLEPIRAEPKYRQHYDFVSTAVPVFAVNDLPIIDDRTDGIWRRMHLLRWDVTIPEYECDTRLSAKLLGEIEGILAWAAHGAERVLARGLQTPSAVRQATNIMRLEANCTAVFCKEVIEQDASHYVSKEDIYQAYAIWCKRNGYRALNNINFTKEMKRSIPEVGESKTRVGYVDWRGRKVMTRINVWTGIHIPAERIERNVGNEVLATAIGSQAHQSEMGYDQLAA